MTFYAVVYSTHSEPGTPRLDNAWDQVIGDAHPDLLKQSLADTLLDSDTERAVIITITVPDEALLQLLASWRPGTALAGTAGQDARS